MVLQQHYKRLALEFSQMTKTKLCFTVQLGRSFDHPPCIHEAHNQTFTFGKQVSFQSLKIFRFKHTRQVSKATAAASSSKSHGLAGRGAKLCSAKLDDFACLASVLLLFGQAVKSGPSPEASLAREMKKTNVAFIV